MNPCVTDVYPNARIRELVLNAVPGWSANNPSICLGPEGYRFIVRSSNFVLDPSGLYHQSVEPEVIRTRNYIGQMNSSLAVTDLRPIDYHLVGDAGDAGWVQGIEDARIYWDYLNNVWRTSGTYRLASGLCRIAVDTLEGNTVIGREIMPGRDPGVPEKNWSPTGRGLEFVQGPWEIDGIQQRGSGNVVLFQGSYLGMMHCCTWPGRMYWHRLAAFALDDHRLLACGPMFFFREPGVEFCNGFEIWGDQVIATFGFRESRCFMAYIPLEEIGRSLLAINP